MTVRFSFSFLFLVCILFFSACGRPSLSEQFRLEKTHWGVDEYKNAAFLIRKMKPSEKPNYASEDTTKVQIVRKIVDVSNFLVIADDAEKEILERYEFIKALLDQVALVGEAYNDDNGSGSFVFPAEATDILIFRNLLNLKYFQLLKERNAKYDEGLTATDLMDLRRANALKLLGQYGASITFFKFQLPETSKTKLIEHMQANFVNIIDSYPEALGLAEYAQLALDFKINTNYYGAVALREHISAVIDDKIAGLTGKD